MVLRMPKPVVALAVILLPLIAGCALSSGEDSTAGDGFEPIHKDGVGGSAGSGGAAGQWMGGAAGDPSAGGGSGGGDIGTGGTGGTGGSGGSGGSIGTPTPAGGGSGGEPAAGGASGAGGTQGGGTGGQCPTGSQPPGPFTMRFDMGTLTCGSSGACSGSTDKCFCQDDFDKLNVSPAHWMAVGTDMHKAQLWAAGNVQAVYVDKLNENIAAGGAARAAAAIDKAKADFPCGVPAWFVVNEISAGLWPDDAGYRQFVIDFAKAMKNTYGKKVIIAAPSATPQANGPSWTAVAQYAYIGVENYLSGKEINAHANSVVWCKAQYQASIDAYAARGVPKSRLVLFEHFGNTSADKGWGRAGVSVAGWHNAIKARSAASKSLGFAGFVSYGWAGNDMGASNADRQAFMATYVAQNLP